jgi:hypothetical protein
MDVSGELNPVITNNGTGGASAIWGHKGGSMEIRYVTLTSGKTIKKVDLRDPTLLLGLEDCEIQELLRKVRELDLEWHSKREAA